MAPAPGRRVPAFVLLSVTAALAYLVVGSAVRPMLIAKIEANHLSLAVRVSAAVAVIIAGLAVLLRNVARPECRHRDGARRRPVVRVCSRVEPVRVPAVGQPFARRKTSRRR